MDVRRINTVNNFSYNNQKKQNLSFGQGKVNAYFDFDNTYCPASHSGLKHMSPSEHPGFVDYCTNLKNFFNNTREGLSFHITTGRTLGEYDAVSHLIRMRGFELPLPDSVITKNGSDEYIKQGSDSEFYQGGKFPFSPDKRNVQKEEDIKALTGWDGQKIKEGLKKIFASHNLKIVEADSEHSTGDYGFRSLFSDGKLKYEDKIQLQEGMKPTSDWNVGLRNDGNCKIFYTLPYDMNFSPERIDIARTIDDEVSELLAQTGANKVHSYNSQHSKECGGRPCYVLEPKVDENLSWHAGGLKKENHGLTKLYDIQQAVAKAIKDNDLVIVAGDGSNDALMLNPMMYIDIDEARYPELAYKHHKSAPTSLVGKIEKNPEKYSEIIKQLEDLPFIGIVVKNDKKDSPLSELVDIFGQNSKYKKIIEVENGHLEDGIREAIKLHASRNPEYMQKLSPDLKKEIFKVSEESKGGGGKKS